MLLAEVQERLGCWRLTIREPARGWYVAVVMHRDEAYSSESASLEYAVNDALVKRDNARLT